MHGMYPSSDYPNSGYSPCQEAHIVVDISTCSVMNFKV